MRSRIVSCMLMSFVLALGTAAPALAGPPEGGSREIGSAVGANLDQSWNCTGEGAASAYLGFGMFEHISRNPLAKGDSGKSADVDVGLTVTGCGGEEWSFTGYSLDMVGIYDLSGMSVNLSHAQLLLADVEMWVPEGEGYVSTGVTVSFDLTWTAVGSPRTTTTVSPADGSVEVFHEADAVATGTVTFEGLDFLSGPLTFTVENAGGQFLQLSTGVVTP